MKVNWADATDSVLRFCGIPSESRVVMDAGPTPADGPGDRGDGYDELLIRTIDGTCLGKLSVPIVETRSIPIEGEAPPPTPPRGNHPMLHERRLTLHRCSDVPDHWRPVLIADRMDERIPIAWICGRDLRISSDLRDALAVELAFPPLLDGYYARKNDGDPSSVATWLGREYWRSRTASTSPDPEVPPATVTLRLDYDRPIEHSNLRSLLDLLTSVDVRSSCGFLLRREEDVDVARMFEDSGHEILLHTEAGDRDAFLRECDLFEARFCRRPLGYTAHGGRGSAGYLGQRQWEWAIEAGMRYGEMLGRKIHRMHPLVIVDSAGIARTTPLVAPGVHFSLDAGMKPEAHNLDALLALCPRMLQPEGHVVIMNHPDLHRDELRTLLEALMAQSPRSLTFADLASEHESVVAQGDFS